MKDFDFVGMIGYVDDYATRFVRSSLVKERVIRAPCRAGRKWQVAMNTEGEKVERKKLCVQKRYSSANEKRETRVVWIARILCADLNLGLVE